MKSSIDPRAEIPTLRCGPKISHSGYEIEIVFGRMRLRLRPIAEQYVNLFIRFRIKFAGILRGEQCHPLYPASILENFEGTPPNFFIENIAKNFRLKGFSTKSIFGEKFRSDRTSGKKRSTAL